MIDENMKKIVRKKLILDIPAALHSQIKARSAFRNCSMTTYVIEAVIQRIAEEQQYEL